LSSAKRIVKRFLQAVRECDHKDCEIELPADDELDPAQVAANGIVPLPDGMGPNGFIAVDFDAEEGSSSRRDTIVTDLTHKEILRPDVPTQTVG
jgi:hypothetical protein